MQASPSPQQQREFTGIDCSSKRAIGRSFKQYMPQNIEGVSVTAVPVRGELKGLNFGTLLHFLALILDMGKIVTDGTVQEVLDNGDLRREFLQFLKPARVVNESGPVAGLAAIGKALLPLFSWITKL